MCGIIAYVGSREAQPILLEGLKRLEYRGYDSAGMAILNGDIKVIKTVGRVSALEGEFEKEGDLPGTMGIAHTRWATHGAVTQPNAHPHLDDSQRFVIIHNGIIENYASLRTWLKEKGHEFYSETDTEVLVNLIAELYDGDLESAVQNALREVTGAYAIAVMCKDEPGTLVAARKGSPLIVGVGSDEYIVASDASGIVAHTSRAITLEDYQVCKLTRDEFRTTTIDNVPVTPKIQELEFELDQIELGSYEHYMLKEIFEQPQALRNCMRGRVDRHEGQIVLGGVGELARDLVKAKRYIMLAQGTALHAGMVGEYLFEDFATVPTEVDYASEFRYRNPIIEEGSVVITVSQSGETADTLSAMTEAKARGATALGVVNVVGSTISRETDAGVYLRVGPEIGVASTKAFTGQVCVLTMLALYLGRRRYMSPEHCRAMLEQLEAVPDKIESVVQQSDLIKAITQKHVHRENWLFLGRGYNYPVALEGALKLKEISYIHAEGMPAAEMKHGPIALIDEGMPVVFIANHGAQYEKVLVNIEEVKSRGGHVIAVATEGDQEIGDLVDDVIYVPEVPEALSPMVTVVPLQLLAYHAAVLRGHDVDKPRNLAKSVTVE
ncbi:MAG: glutamine--fructose-6-phosphate transaminase (isomerizing) [Planctomycetota bacterium]|jgi:glucosamine--fructose-6-phosphate aminotransferase (isomerizing)